MNPIQANARYGPTLLLALLLGGCGGDAGTGIDERHGSILVRLAMGGNDLDSDGCEVSVDDSAARRIDSGDSLRFSNLTVGTHAVRLSDVQNNCTVGGDNPRSVLVNAGETSTIRFSVSCSLIFPTEIAEWLQANTVPFSTAGLSERPTDFSDLMLLKDMVGNARLVALGEATHGTREFFQMKHRLLAFLVKELGFSMFAIEATWPEANRLNEYVHTGVGDPHELLSGLYFWTWNTEEVLEMIQWMRQHNLSPGGAPTVSFFGFDMQFPGMAMHNVLIFLESIDPATAAFADDKYTCMRPYANDHRGLFPADYVSASPSYQNACRSDLDAVYDSLLAKQTTYEAATSPEQFARALRSARVVVQYEDMAAERLVFARDLYMAENAAWLLEQAGPDDKIVLWAHNAHVNNNPSWMGSHLRARYGSDLVIVGFDFYEGSFQAVTWTDAGFGALETQTVGPPIVYSYEYYFHGGQLPRFVLDLRGVDLGSPATSWLSGPRAFRSIGAAYRPTTPAAFFYDARLPEEYDVIVYFNDTNASVGLPFVYPTDW